MCGDDNSMDEILENIRALKRGKPPSVRPRSEVPRAGNKAWILVIPACLLAISLSEYLISRLELHAPLFIDFAIFFPVILMSETVANARPRDGWGWWILALATLASGVSSASFAVAAYGLLAHFAKDYADGQIAAFVVVIAASSAGLLPLFGTHYLTRADELTFPAGRKRTRKIEPEDARE